MLTNNEYQIIDHTLTRAANKAYCASENNVKTLVEKGYMYKHCEMDYVPEPYWCVTKEGKDAYIKELNRRFSK